jgi:antitoxin component YwqK of YwqJK toxin-antitoxin module
MKTEEFISISIGNTKYFYKASLEAKQTKVEGGAATEGIIPDGKVRDFHATVETSVMYKNGEIVEMTTTQDTKVLDEQLAPGSAQPAPLPAPQHTSDADAPVKQGKTFITVYPERIFYSDGIEVCRQKLDLGGNPAETVGLPFNGPARSFYPNGSLKQEGSFYNGCFEGEVKTYDSNGRLISIENYKNGLKEGESSVFSFTAGILTEQKFEYLKGKLNGRRRSYSSDGRLIVVENFKNGKLDGLMESYYYNGNKENTSFYKNDKLEGRRVLYYENGSPTYEENYKRGKLEGKRTGYYPDGKIYLEENYRNGKLDGERKLYDEKGNLSARQLYAGGVLKEGGLTK